MLITGNFDVIKTYNASTSYALGVGLLGDAIVGGKTLVARWPTADRTLTMDQVRRLQAKLKQIGYNPGDVDGMVGEALRSALRAYQERKGLKPDGYATLSLMQQVEAEKPGSRGPR